MKKLVVFDLDGTLAQSKASIDSEMAELLGKLLGTVKAALISGGDWPQFEKQVLSHLGHRRQPQEPVDPPDVWNQVLQIRQRLGKALRRGFHQRPENEDHQFPQQGDRSVGAEGGKGLGRGDRRPGQSNHVFSARPASSARAKEEMGP